MNRIKQLFQEKDQNILSVFSTAGYPKLNDTVPILEALQNSGADLIEIGIPFSDPMADGPTIQQSSDVALKNGMRLEVLFEQLKIVRQTVKIPLILMGYLNPVMQYGMEKFIQKCSEVGIDGLILPDLPVYEYQTHYEELFKAHDLKNIFLISPQTSEARVKQIDQLSDAFIYMVATSGTTGSKKSISPDQVAYFDRIKALNLKNPVIAGFGISDKASFRKVCQHAQGAIIGSAFVKAVTTDQPVEATKEFIVGILGS